MRDIWWGLLVVGATALPSSCSVNAIDVGYSSSTSYTGGRQADVASVPTTEDASAPPAGDPDAAGREGGDSGGSSELCYLGVSIEKVSIALYFVVNSTASMDCAISAQGDRCTTPNTTPSTRWSLFAAALKQFVRAVDNENVGVGLGLYPRECACADQWWCDCTSSLPKISCGERDYAYASAEIAMAPDAENGILEVLSHPFRGSESPLLPALRGAFEYADDRIDQWVMMRQYNRKAAIVLVTDELASGCDQSGEQNAVEAAVSLARSSFIPIHVIGLGPNLEPLNRLAEAGKTRQAYLIDTEERAEEKIGQALKSIRDSANGCVVVSDFRPSLPSRPKAPHVADVTECSEDNGGWYYDQASKLGLCPVSCERGLRADDNMIDLALECQ